MQHPFCVLNPGLAMSASHIYIQKLLQQGGPNSVGSNLGEVVSLDILIYPNWNVHYATTRALRHEQNAEEVAPATASCYNATSTARSAKHECSKCELAAGGESLKLTGRC